MKSPTKQDLEKLCHHSQIYFAVFCAEQVFHLIEEKHKPICRHAIDIAKLFIEGKATKEECNAAADDAYVAYAAYAASSAVDAATAVTAYAAAADAAAVAATAVTAYAVDAAYVAATYAALSQKAQQTIIEAQWEYYKELLVFETIIEDVLLG